MGQLAQADRSAIFSYGGMITGSKNLAFTICEYCELFSEAGVKANTRKHQGVRMKILLTLSLAATLPVFAGVIHNGKPVDKQIVRECQAKANAECKDKTPMKEMVQCLETVRLNCIGEKMEGKPE